MKRDFWKFRARFLLRRLVDLWVLHLECPGDTAKSSRGDGGRVTSFNGKILCAHSNTTTTKEGSFQLKSSGGGSFIPGPF